MAAATEDPISTTDVPAEATYRQADSAAVEVRRYVNDEIARVGGRFDAEKSSEFEFLCECGSLGCRAVVKLTLAEYGVTSPGSVVGHA